MRCFRNVAPQRIFCGLLAIAVVAGLLYEAGPVTRCMEALSSAATLLAAFSTEGQIESCFELLVEDCQAQGRRLQLAWQRLSLSYRMSFVAVFRVAGPAMLLLLLSFLESVRRPSSRQGEQGTKC